MQKVENGHYVKVHYTGKLENGEVFDSSQGSQPLEVQVGSGQVIKGFEDALVGMEPTETKTFTLSSDEAYGERDEAAEQSFMRSNLPPDFSPSPGEMVALQTADGRRVPAMVKDADDEKVIIDLNHPLAGKSLTFDVEVVEINDQPTQASGCGPCAEGGSCGTSCC